MLKPLVRGILCGLLVDNVLFAAIMAGLSFAFDFYVPGPYESGVERMHGLQILRYWLMFAGGALLALLLALALHYRVQLLLPRWRQLRESLVDVMIYSMTVFVLVFYDVDMDNTAGVFREPFASGIFVAAALLWISMFVINFILHLSGFGRYNVPVETIYTNNNRTAVYVCTVVMLVDMCAFEHSWAAALLLVGFIVAVRVLRLVLESYAAVELARRPEHRRKHN